jgi:hypothetical protein
MEPSRISETLVSYHNPEQPDLDGIEINIRVIVCNEASCIDLPQESIQGQAVIKGDMKFLVP